MKEKVKAVECTLARALLSCVAITYSYSEERGSPLLFEVCDETTIPIQYYSRFLSVTHSTLIGHALPLARASLGGRLYPDDSAHSGA